LRPAPAKNNPSGFMGDAMNKAPARLNARERFRAKYGPWAVVTGASEGIGREFAICLARNGIHLVLVARRRDQLDQLAAQVAQAYGVEARVLNLDLARSESIDALEAETAALDVGLLIAAAGFGTSGPLINSSPRAELEMVDVNCRAVLALAQTFGRRFAARGRGGLVLMSSLLAFQGVPLAANYAATKAYVQTLAEGLRHELRPFGVDVIAAAPGPIRSGFGARADMRMSLSQTPDVVAQATLAALGSPRTVRPGWLSKALEASLAPLPRRGRTWIMAQVMAGMTRHQHDQSERPTEEPA